MKQINMQTFSSEREKKKSLVQFLFTGSNFQLDSTEFTAANHVQTA